MSLSDHQIRQRQIHSIHPCLPESIQLCSPVIIFMGTAGERDAQNRIAILSVQGLKQGGKTLQ
ncbi:hypothetical protein BT09F24_34590 [Escherichia coli]|nr:hypothetical protein VEE40_20120 [Escherichia coli]